MAQAAQIGTNGTNMDTNGTYGTNGTNMDTNCNIGTNGTSRTHLDTDITADTNSTDFLLVLYEEIV